MGVKLKNEFDDERRTTSSEAGPSQAETSQASFADDTDNISTYTQPRKWFAENQSMVSDFSVANACKVDEDDFPPISRDNKGASSRKHNRKSSNSANDSTRHDRHVKHELVDVDNPWGSRNKNVAREPLDSSLSFSVGGKTRMHCNYFYRIFYNSFISIRRSGLLGPNPSQVRATTTQRPWQVHLKFCAQFV